MSSHQIRRADRAMSDQRMMETLARGYSGRLATISEDGFPYCIPLLYLWIDGEVYVHTSSARGHFRANIERNTRVCFEVDEQEGVFDYGRFECDSGLAYQSICLFGRIRIVEHWGMGDIAGVLARGPRHQIRPSHPESALLEFELGTFRLTPTHVPTHVSKPDSGGSGRTRKDDALANT